MPANEHRDPPHRTRSTRDGLNWPHPTSTAAKNADDTRQHSHHADPCTIRAKHPAAAHPVVPNAPGIYLFSHESAPVYVGQSRKLQNRLRQHTGATNSHNQASFAFNLAKREAKKARVDIKRFRSALELDPTFAGWCVAAA